jgi:hypothetical protein
MGGLDGSLVLFQFTPAQTSKKVIRYHFRSRDVPPVQESAFLAES